MDIIAFGINHKSASVDLRGRVSFAPEVVVETLGSALPILQIDEIAILSTCNRTEIYAVGDLSDQQLLEWLATTKALDVRDIENCYYCYRGKDAIRHLICVASGLDSLVVGEPQIFGQIKSAYSVAQKAQTVSGQLNMAFQWAFAVAKRVRSETAIGKNPVSVAYASVCLAEQIFSDLKSANALLIGAGETIELVARYLQDKKIGQITVANRTLERAKELAEDFSAEAILLADMPEHLHRADIVISSTASQLPVLGKGAVEAALKRRLHKPMFMVDVAVPRDIEPQVEELDDVYLYTVDDLEEVIQDNLKARQSAADLAQQIVDEEVENWSSKQRELSVVDTIKAFRDSAEIIRDTEIEKALAALDRGQDSSEVITILARNLTNKLLHKPTTKLKQAGEKGCDDTINVTQALFDLDKK
ncbi:MAG: glutamyl-tRNA reductase [Porticoccaceae bacterium]|nr:glutamyl-tRNA reductase [Porticoccaceae bacterium]